MSVLDHQPVAADQHQHDHTGTQRLVQGFDKVDAEFDGFDVAEDALLAEGIGQVVGQPAAWRLSSRR